MSKNITLATPSAPRMGEAYVAYVQGLRQSGASGIHRKKTKDRRNTKRKAIEHDHGC